MYFNVLNSFLLLNKYQRQRKLYVAYIKGWLTSHNPSKKRTECFNFESVRSFMKSFFGRGSSVGIRSRPRENYTFLSTGKQRCLSELFLVPCHVEYVETKVISDLAFSLCSSWTSPRHYPSPPAASWMWPRGYIRSDLHTLCSGNEQLLKDCCSTKSIKFRACVVLQCRRGGNLFVFSLVLGNWRSRWFQNIIEELKICPKEGKPPVCFTSSQGLQPMLPAFVGWLLMRTVYTVTVQSPFVDPCGKGFFFLEESFPNSRISSK